MQLTNHFYGVFYTKLLWVGIYQGNQPTLKRNILENQPILQRNMYRKSTYSREEYVQESNLLKFDTKTAQSLSKKPTCSRRKCIGSQPMLKIKIYLGNQPTLEEYISETNLLQRKISRKSTNDRGNQPDLEEYIQETNLLQVGFYLGNQPAQDRIISRKPTYSIERIVCVSVCERGFVCVCVCRS